MLIKNKFKKLLKVDRKHRSFKENIVREKQWALARWLRSQKALTFIRGVIYILQGWGKIWMSFAGRAMMGLQSNIGPPYLQKTVFLLMFIPIVSGW
jgi:hypothetical protein